MSSDAADFLSCRDMSRKVVTVSNVATYKVSQKIGNIYVLWRHVAYMSATFPSKVDSIKIVTLFDVIIKLIKTLGWGGVAMQIVFKLALF